MNNLGYTSDPHEALERDEEFVLIRSAMAVLQGIEDRVVKLRSLGHTLNTIVQNIGKTKERDRQIEARALLKIAQTCGLERHNSPWPATRY